MMKKFLIIFLVWLGVSLSSATSEPNIYSPVIVSKYTNERGIAKFVGRIREDETVVRLDPLLVAYDNDTSGGPSLICGYNITTTKHNIPFVVELMDRSNGAAQIKLAEGRCLNFDKRRHYKFNIVAFDCAGWPNVQVSKRAVVSVTVEKVANFAPVFDKLSYYAELEEGEIYPKIVQLEAHGDACSPKFHGICGYDILTPDVPFIIDGQGILKNTKIIRYSERHNFILEAVARDCEGHTSRSVFINLRIRETCRNGWKNFPSSIEYTPGSGQQTLASEAELQVCEDTCTPENIEVSIELATKHIGKGCDRDTYSITSQRKLCGASGNSIDLLPTPTLTSNWTKDLPTDDGHEGDQIYGFNGRNTAVEVPRGVVDHQLSEHFTLSTWMRHQAPVGSSSTEHKQGEKEHILCMSDGDGMDRNHYSWYIHNKKLIFLLRREAKDAKDLEVFKPAEFRWHLDQINDGEWHHYAISVDFPNVDLYVDGKLFVADDDNLEIIDDWPLHPTDRVHSTKLVVGACWKGKEQQYDGHFQGYLAGLSMLKDKTESDRVIKCLNNCQESLDFNSLSDMQSGTSISFNSDMTVVRISSRNATEIEKLVQEVSYVNARSFPTPGRRNVNIRTTVHCGTTEEVLPLVESYVLVGRSVRPVIKISGKSVVQGTFGELEEGLNILQDLKVQVEFYLPPGEVPEVDNTQGQEEDSDEDEEESTDVLLESHTRAGVSPEGLKESHLKSTLVESPILQAEKKSEVLLDVCTIRAEPPLNYYVEHLDIPHDQIKQLNMKLEGVETETGLVILSADTVQNYVSVLRNIKYVHTDGKNFDSRRLIVSCSSQNERFISNEFIVEVVPIREEHETLLKAQAQRNQLHQSLVEPDLLQRFQAGAPAATTNFGMVAIIVVCVGFLLFMIVLGVLRIRASHNKTRVLEVEEQKDLDWDNSELNITVNPIDQELFEYEENPLKSTMPDDSDTDDDASSCFHDDENDSSDEEGETEVKTLEWDDSTLSY